MHKLHKFFPDQMCHVLNVRAHDVNVSWGGTHIFRSEE
jgi:hypothetical protein